MDVIMKVKETGFPQFACGVLFLQSVLGWLQWKLIKI